MELHDRLKAWQQAGLIDPATAEQISAFEHKQPKKTKLPLLLIIGLIFFSLAVFSFIAANWQAMPASLKIGLVLLLMWLFYIIAHFAERKNFGWPHAFRLIGLAMFGAAIIVAIQAFHLALSTPVLAWAIFIAAILHYFYWQRLAYAIVAFIFGIRLLFSSIETLGWIQWLVFIAVALAWFYFSKTKIPAVLGWLLLFGSGLMLWTLVDYDSALWPIWTLFALVLLLVAVPEEKADMVRPYYLILAGIQLLVYLSIRGAVQTPLDSLNWTESALLLAVGLGIAALCYVRFRTITWIGVLGLVGILLFDDTAIGLAIVVEAAILGFLFIANRQERPLALGFVYFILAQFVLYFIYAWERLDMSLFFLLGAFLLFALSGLAWWFNRRKAGVES